MPGFLRDQLVFYNQILRSTEQVGAFSPTTMAVARAVAAPINPSHRPLRVLEVGAGTGTLTRGVYERLNSRDTLDLVEINPIFSRILRDRFVAQPAGPQVQLLNTDVTKLEPSEPYDVLISSLPLLNFPPAKVEEIWRLYLDRLLRPDGTLAYYDYWAKSVRRFLGSHRDRVRTRKVLALTKQFHDSCHYRRKVIVRNFPPACVHYLQKRA